MPKVLEITDGHGIYKIMKLSDGMSIYIPEVTFFTWCAGLLGIALGILIMITLGSFGVV